MKKSLFLAIGCLLLAQVSVTAIPSQITYQGTLKQQGVPVTGTTKHMHFAITNADGSQQYGNAVDAMVPINQGLFSVPLTFTGVDWQNVTPYIQVTVENTVLGPPEAVTATVYATIAFCVVNGAIGTPQLAAQAVTSPQSRTARSRRLNWESPAVNTANIADGAVTWVNWMQELRMSPFPGSNCPVRCRLSERLVAPFALHWTNALDGGATPEQPAGVSRIRIASQCNPHNHGGLTQATRESRSNIRRRG